ncbi:NUDIX hydrolase [Dyadobacter bucti]|uniref:NUDIX hydrolase n=1 Tax=Dyadobacter bucti TaxID=2572203 RepID=UPI003F6EF3B5
MIDKLALIEIQNKKILSARSIGRDVFYIPGGKREAGESDEEALVREIEEELSVKIDPSTLVFYGEFQAQAHNHPDGVMVRMRCYITTALGPFYPAAEIEEVRWLSCADMDIISTVDKIIFDDLRSRGLLD